MKPDRIALRGMCASAEGIPPFSVIVFLCHPGSIGALPHQPLRRKRRGRRVTLASLRRSGRARLRMFRKITKAVLASPPTVRTVVILVVILVCWPRRQLDPSRAQQAERGPSFL